MSVSGYNFIAGQRSGQGDTLVFSIDAHTGEHLPGGFRQATLEEVDAAVAGAMSADQAPQLCRRPGDGRICRRSVSRRRLHLSADAEGLIALTPR